MARAPWIFSPALVSLLFVSAASAIAGELPPGALPATFKSPRNSSEPLPTIEDRSLLETRQYCEEGYGWCSRAGCCKLGISCCSWGYCMETNDEVCCPGGICDPGWNCCGKQCAPVGGDCCFDERHCKPGYYCYKLDSGGSGCWPRNGGGGGEGNDDDGEDTPPETNPEPTSGGGDGDEETSADATPAPTMSDESARWYSAYITWWYWSYYRDWRETVTSSRHTTTTTISVYATNSLEATESISEMSATMTFRTPADATALASLTGSTSTSTSEPTDSPNSMNSAGGGMLLSQQSGWAMACVALGVLVPGILMVQL